MEEVEDTQEIMFRVYGNYGSGFEFVYESDSLDDAKEYVEEEKGEFSGISAEGGYYISIAVETEVWQDDISKNLEEEESSK